MRRVRGAAVETVVVNAANMGLGLASSIVLARALGLTGRGELAAAMLWPMLLVFFGNVGVVRATLYFTARPGTRPAAVLGNALALAALQSVGLVVLGYLALPWLLPSQSAEVVALGRLFLAVVPVWLCSQIALSAVQASVHLRSFNLLRTLVPLGYVVGCVVLAQRGELDVRAALLLQLGLSGLLAAMSLGYVFVAGIARRLEVDRGLLREMLSYGVRVQAGNVSSGLNLRLDQAVLAAWLPPAALGLYVAAVSAASPAQVLATAVRMVATPLVARAPAGERARLIARFVRQSLLANLVVVGALALLLPWLVPLVFGAEFAGAVVVAEVLLVAALILGVKDVLAGCVEAAGRPWLASRAEIAALGVTLVGLALLVPFLGVVGAALASVLAYATALAVLLRGAARSLAVSSEVLFRAPSGGLARVKASVARWLCSAALGRALGRLLGNRVRSGACQIVTTPGIVAPSTTAALFFGLYEKAELRFVERWLRRDLDVVELGSSIGVVAAHLARRLEPGRRLVCVEANPALLPLLAENVRRNAPDVALSIHHGAIAYEGGGNGRVRLALGETNVASRLAMNGEVHSVEVPALSLSGVLGVEALGRYALVADIEGAEAGILLRDADALRACEQIIIELHATDAGGVFYGVDDLLRVLVAEHRFTLRARHGPVCVLERPDAAGQCFPPQ